MKFCRVGFGVRRGNRRDVTCVVFLALDAEFVHLFGAANVGHPLLRTAFFPLQTSLFLLKQQFLWRFFGDVRLAHGSGRWLPAQSFLNTLEKDSRERLLQ